MPKNKFDSEDEFLPPDYSDEESIDSGAGEYVKEDTRELMKVRNPGVRHPLLDILENVNGEEDEDSDDISNVLPESDDEDEKPTRGAVKRIVTSEEEEEKSGDSGNDEEEGEYISLIISNALLLFI